MMANNPSVPNSLFFRCRFQYRLTISLHSIGLMHAQGKDPYWTFFRSVLLSVSWLRHLSRLVPAMILNLDMDGSFPVKRLESVSPFLSLS